MAYSVIEQRCATWTVRVQAMMEGMMHADLQYVRLLLQAVDEAMCLDARNACSK